MTQKVIVIVGPTAVGKTALSIDIAKKYKGQIISGDSMQVYKNLDIGTAKITPDEMEDIKHYMIDILQVQQRFSVADFIDNCRKDIKEIANDDNIPIIVGGTGFYLQALLDGYSLGGDTFDQLSIERRKKWQLFMEKNGKERLWEELAKLDIVAARKIPINNSRRVIRALEVIEQTGRLFSEQHDESNEEFEPLLIGLNTQRSTLYERINKRVDIMLENGLLNEINSLKEDYKTSRILNSGIGYKEFYDYLYNNKNLEDVIDDIKKNSRHFAKRQYTFFNHQFNTNWFEVDLNNFSNTINEVINFLKKF